MINFLISHQNYIFDPSSEPSHRDGSNEGLQLMVLCRINKNCLPGRVAQSVGHLTRKSGVLGSIPGLATYFRFSFRFFKKGSCQLLAKVCAVRLTDRPDMTLDVYRGRKTTMQQQQKLSLIVTKYCLLSRVLHNIICSKFKNPHWKFQS